MYYSLMFAISWGCILIVLGLGGFFGATPISDGQMPLVYVATLAGPSIAGLLSTFIIFGRSGIRDIKARLFRWRIGARWYAIALITAPLIMTTVLLSLSLTPAIVSSPDKVSLLISGIMAGLLVPLFEELGWTGFAVPQLRKDYSVLATGLIVGLLWGIWHFPLFSSSATTSGVAPTIYLLVLLFSWLPAYRVLMVWVYDHTKSLLVMILMHFPIVVSQFVLLPLNMSGISIITFDIIFTVVLWSIVAMIILSSRKKLSFFRKKEEP